MLSHPISPDLGPCRGGDQLLLVAAPTLEQEGVQQMVGTARLPIISLLPPPLLL